MINENWLKLDVCHRKDDNASPLSSMWVHVVNVYVQTYKMFMDGSIAPIKVNNSAKLKIVYKPWQQKHYAVVLAKTYPLMYQLLW